MAVNEAALDLICEAEGTRLRWYRDPVGIWTVGIGHTDAAGDPKYADTKDKTFTEAEVRAILLKDLAQYEAIVRKSVPKANENQVGALTSFTYNVGPSNFLRSTLLKRLEAGDFAGAAKQFAVWNKGRVNGKLVVLPGLVKRRAAEAELFLTPVGAPAPSSATSGIWQAVAALLKLILSLFGRKAK